MFVSNKFAIGEEVFFMDYKRRPCKAKVKRIDIIVTSEDVSFTYLLDVPEDVDDSPWYDEDYLFYSEWDLKDKWMKDLIEFV